MIDDHIQSQLRHRLEWALEEHRDATNKLYTLVSGKITREDRATWIEITNSLANTESHLVNALRRVPEVQKASEPIPPMRSKKTGHAWLDAKIEACEDWEEKAIRALEGKGAQ